jgi:hypothetical protein
MLQPQTNPVLQFFGPITCEQIDDSHYYWFTQRPHRLLYHLIGCQYTTSDTLDNQISIPALLHLQSCHPSTSLPTPTWFTPLPTHTQIERRKWIDALGWWYFEINCYSYKNIMLFFSPHNIFSSTEIMNVCANKNKWDGEKSREK